ncbi:MAG: CotH kinase family protein, partial [Bacteroidota bacterium]
EVIDDTMVKNQFGEDEGNIYKPENNLTKFTEATFEKKNNSSEADYSDVKKLVEILNGPLRSSNPEQWRTELEKVFDVQHFLKYLAINNTIVNWDSYGAIAHNFYLYNDKGKLKWIPWDHNLSMTTTGGGTNRTAVTIDMQAVTNQWPLIRYLADQEIYYSAYKKYAGDFINSTFTPSKIYALIDKYQTLISPYVVGTEPEVAGYTYLKSAADFTNSASILKNHVKTRNEQVADFLKK